MKHYISPRSRTGDQMTQASRSGTQNVAEGAKEEGLKGYIKLSGIARAPLEELLKDFLAFARQRKIEIWSSGEGQKGKMIPPKQLIS